MTRIIVVVCVVFLIALLVSSCTGTAVTENKETPASEPMMAHNTRCIPSQTMVEELFKQYREVHRGSGRVNTAEDAPPLMASLFYSENGAWTILLTRADGISCLMVWGSKWRMSAPPKGST